MKKDFKCSEELILKIIDFLYEIKSESKGWARDKAKEIIFDLEKEQYN